MASGTFRDRDVAGYTAWEGVASQWERWLVEMERTYAPVRHWLVRELAAGPADTVVELAAAAGDTGLDTAEQVGATGRVIISDVSPALLAVARRRGAGRGLTNVDYQILDAEDIALGERSVDRLLCRFAYHLLADPPRALAEARRVLRPGGRLALAVPGAAARNPFLGIVAGSLVRHGRVPVPQPEAVGPAMADPARTAALLHAAGFADVRTEEVPMPVVLPDADTYLRVAADIRNEVLASLARFATDDGYQLPGVALCAVANWWPPVRTSAGIRPAGNSSARTDQITIAPTCPESGVLPMSPGRVP